MVPVAYPGAYGESTLYNFQQIYIYGFTYGACGESDGFLPNTAGSTNLRSGHLGNGNACDWGREGGRGGGFRNGELERGRERKDKETENEKRQTNTNNSRNTGSREGLNLATG